MEDITLEELIENVKQLELDLACIREFEDTRELSNLHLAVSTYITETNNRD